MKIFVTSMIVAFSLVGVFGFAVLLIDPFGPGVPPTVTPMPSPTQKTYVPVSIEPVAVAYSTPEKGLNLKAASGVVCDRVPENWVPYTIKSGDRLVHLASHYGLTIEQLAYFNCLPDPDKLSIGQVIYVPSEPIDSLELDLSFDVPDVDREGEEQVHDAIFENNLVVINCRYTLVDSALDDGHCPRPPVDMLTVAGQYSGGWVFYFPSFNQFFVQLTNGTQMPVFDESNLSAGSFEDVTPEETIVRFVQTEELGNELGSAIGTPTFYVSTVQWAADRQKFSISLPQLPQNPVTTAIEN